MIAQLARGVGGWALLAAGAWSVGYVVGRYVFAVFA